MYNYILLIVLSLAGFGISYYINYTRSNNKKLKCFLGGSCNEIITGKYSNTFGVHNEVYGMAYYVFIIFSLIIFFLEKATNIPFFELSILVASIISVLFAIRLFFVQMIVLKKFCEWCVSLIVISMVILFILIV